MKNAEELSKAPDEKKLWAAAALILTVVFLPALIAWSVGLLH